MGIAVYKGGGITASTTRPLSVVAMFLLIYEKAAVMAA